MDILLTIKLLHVMLDSGVPLNESIEMIKDQSTNDKLKSILVRVIERVDNGSSLYEAIKPNQADFGVFTVHMIRVGESSGTLVESLEYLSIHLEKQYDLNRKVKSALLYPEIIFIAMLIIGSYISLIILPQLIGFFDSFDVTLPVTTQILLGIANYMKNYGLITFSVLTIVTIVVYRIFQTKGLKKHWHRGLLSLPLFGRILILKELTQITYILSTLINNGVDITDAMNVATQTSDNLVYKDILKKIDKKITKGSDFGDAVQSIKDTKLIPPMISKMLKVGSSTGNLGKSMAYIANFYDKEIDTITKNLTTILEPIILLVIGAFVGFVAMAVISPIYELTGSIR